MRSYLSGVRIYREHVCNLIILAVYSIYLYRDPVCILIVLYVYSCVSRPCSYVECIICVFVCVATTFGRCTVELWVLDSKIFIWM